MDCSGSICPAEVKVIPDFSGSSSFHTAKCCDTSGQLAYPQLYLNPPRFSPSSDIILRFVHSARASAVWTASPCRYKASAYLPSWSHLWATRETIPPP